MLAGGDSPAPSAAQACHPAYTYHRVPPVRRVGELDYRYVSDQGIDGIVPADPYNDPRGSNGWNALEDGYGREG
jgi:hypothetical protein